MAFPGKPIDPSQSLNRMGNHRQTNAPIVEEDTKPLQAVERFQSRSPRFQLADVILPQPTRQNVEAMLNRIRYHDLIYHTWELSKIDPVGACKAINFYGPPGTGKTMLAEAVAAELGMDLIEVSYAEIESKYVGETPKNIRAAFQQAQDSATNGKRGALLFFDEADSILGRRMTNVTQAADHSVNVSRAVMLKQLDEFAGVVVFATNLARNFDGAFVRRILLHVEVPAPDREGRKALWRRMISPKVPTETIDWDALADASDGLVGGDIKNALIIALSAVAPRKGSQQRLALNDLLNAISDVRRAKKDIGRYDYDRD